MGQGAQLAENISYFLWDPFLRLLKNWWVDMIEIFDKNSADKI